MHWDEMTFGVEIECYSPISHRDLARRITAAGVRTEQVLGSIHATRSTWKVVSDASLRASPVGMTGAEIVSPILSGEDGLEQVRKVCAVLQAEGCKVNTSCGLHVHLGAGNASAVQIKNLAKMFVKYEHHFDAVCPLSRRASNYARSNRAFAAAGNIYTTASGYALVADVFAKLDAVRSIRKVAEVMNGGFDAAQYSQHRYFKLNFQSLNTHGTVEFRQQAGTVDGEKTAAWVKTCAQFTAHSFTLRTVASSAEPTFAKFVKKLDRDTAAYMTQRRSRLNQDQNEAA